MAMMLTNQQEQVGCLAPGPSLPNWRPNHACMITNANVVYLMIFVRTWEGKAQLILKTIVEVQGADRRFDKHKKRGTLCMSEYPPAMICIFFAVHKALKYGRKIYQI